MSVTRRILVVDDERQIRLFLKVALEAVGYQVLQAETGAQAVRLAASAAPEAVILDLGLPDRDGKEVLADIRSFSSVPVIVLSARDQEAEKIAALDLVLTTMSRNPLASANCWHGFALQNGTSRAGHKRQRLSMSPISTLTWICAECCARETKFT